MESKPTYLVSLAINTLLFNIDGDEEGHNTVLVLIHGEMLLN
jgi:hypothetical protein